jgi:hypothetical protein
MKIGRFTITNLTESDKSDVSEGQVPVNPDESIEYKPKLEKSSIPTLLKPLDIDNLNTPVPKRIGIQETLTSNVLNM